MSFMLKERLVFFDGFLKNFEHTGSFCATSRWAAEQLSHPISNPADRTSMRILEVGAGTGSVTRAILSKMGVLDTLTVCELNEEFMSSLRATLPQHGRFSELKERISFFQGPVQELPEIEQYDAIICSLPFLNFPPALVAEIFAKLERIGSESSVMTYYEYCGIRAISKQISPPERKRRIREIDRFFRENVSKKLLGKTREWFNLLPIDIYTVNLKSGKLIPEAFWGSSNGGHKPIAA